MPYEPIEERRMYKRAEDFSDRIWEVVCGWEYFAKDTVGKQLARSTDSIGANIAEAGGRFHPGDVIKFLFYARGSLRETKFWLRRCVTRKLMPEQLQKELDAEHENLSMEINSTIRHQRQRKLKDG
jgi:four helix bundle protein